MLDRTIPFYNTILRCDHYSPKDIVLPKGFSIAPYKPGYESAWAKLECSTGDFSSADEAEQYFVSAYLQESNQQNNILFLQNERNMNIGTVIAWRDKRGDSEVSSLHWLVIDEEYQGQGLGKALCYAVMNKFYERRGLPVYIHTQPWSWKAILLYVSLGFKLQKKDTFSHYENEYLAVMAVLKRILPENQFENLLDASE